MFSGNQKYQNKWGCGIDNIKEEHKPWVTIPYIQGLSENIKNILKENGVTTFYKPQNTRRIVYSWLEVSILPDHIIQFLIAHAEISGAIFLFDDDN